MIDDSAGLREALDRAAAGAPSAALAAVVERLIGRYRAVAAADAPILASRTDVLAYALYRMPATYGALRLALRQAVAAGLGQATSLLDLGGGTGAAVWAAAEELPGLASATVLEQVPAALELGRSLVAGHPLPPIRWEGWRLGEAAPTADLVTVSYVLSELSAAQQAAVVARAADSARVGVLVIEPGTPDGYRRVLGARAELLERGWQVLAPCPHQLTCPLAGTDWCHFAARVNRSALHRRLKGGELGHEDEKFSYVVAVPPDAVAGGGASGEARVIRHPLKRKGMVELQLCRPDGSAGRQVVSKRTGPAYKEARELSWGDGWRNPD